MNKQATPAPGAIALNVMQEVARLNLLHNPEVQPKHFSSLSGAAGRAALADLRALIARCEQAEAHAERLAAALDEAAKAWPQPNTYDAVVAAYREGKWRTASYAIAGLCVAFALVAAYSVAALIPYLPTTR